MLPLQQHPRKIRDICSVDTVVFDIKEQAKQLIDQLPRNKVEQILIFLTGIKFDDDLEDDLFCMNLLNEYLKDDDEHKHDTISIEEFAKQEGVIL